MDKLDLFVMIFFCYVFTNQIAATHYPFELFLTACLPISYILGKTVKEGKLKHIAYIALGFFLLHATIGILQNFSLIASNHGIFKLTGFTFNPGPYIIYTTCCFLIYFSWFIYCFPHRNPSVISYIIPLISCLSFFYLLVSSQSRSAWLAITMIIILLLIYRLRNNKRTFWTFSFIIGLALIAYCTFIFQYKIDSSYGRIFIWRNSSEVIKDNFLFGVGKGNFDTAYLKYQHLFFNAPNKSEFIHLAGDVRYAFNDYIQLLCEQGLIGVLLFGVIIFWSTKSIKSRIESQVFKNSSLIVFYIPLIFMAIVSMFTYTLQLIEFKILFWFLMGITTPKSIVINIKNNVSNNAAKFVGVLLGLGLVLVSTTRLAAFYRYFSLKANKSIETSAYEKLSHSIGDDPNFILDLSKLQQSKNEFDKAISVLKHALEIHPERQFYYELAAVYAKSQQKDNAESIYKYISQAHPNLLYPKYLLAKHYFSTKQERNWNQAAREVLYFKPKISSNQILTMKREISGLLFSDQSAPQGSKSDPTPETSEIQAY